jgi:tetratricopeptide (TPR) repeat protein
MIYTFYSYKGGVGRSMALANIAELLVEAGLSVIMVDWDLEAPGLERFFPVDLATVLERPGLVDMLLGYKMRLSQALLPRATPRLPEDKRAWYFGRLEDYLVEIYPAPRADSEAASMLGVPRTGRLRLLTAGRRSKGMFEQYVRAVRTFDWQDFYVNWGGEAYFEWLREQLDQADAVLIDSRTGVSEMGGVCTYHMADVVVLFCATNEQNLDGVHKMAADIVSLETQALRPERPLQVLVVPARVEFNEGDKLNQFKPRFLTQFRDLAPKLLASNPDRLWDLAIPYIPYYAYSEAVAVCERALAIAEPMVRSFENLVRVLAAMAPVGSMIGLGYGQLRPHDPLDRVALYILDRAACFAPGIPIPSKLLMAAIASVVKDQLQAEDALVRLMDLRLLEREADGLTRMHRLVAAFVRSRSMDPAAQSAVEDIVMAEVESANASGNPRPLLAWQAHLRYVTDAAKARADERAATLCTEMGQFLYTVADYRGAQLYFERALAIREQALGPTHPAVATSLNNLALLYDAQGRYGDAEPLYRRALAIVEQGVGLTHPDVAASLNNLAELYRAQGRYGDAEPLYRRALALYEQLLGPDHPDVAVSLNNLAEVWHTQGRYAAAEPLYQRALAICEQVLGQDHSYVDVIRKNYIALLRAMSRTEEAERLEAQAQTIQKRRTRAESL